MNVSSLKELAADLRRVWEPPTTSAWGLMEVRLMRLLRAIDSLPNESKPDARTLPGAET